MPEQPLPNDIAELAREIEAYLSAHPEAADTLTGIARWWLARQRLEDAAGKIEQALAVLAARGVVSTRSLGNGERLYARNPPTAGGRRPEGDD